MSMGYNLDFSNYTVHYIYIADNTLSNDQLVYILAGLA